MKPSIQKMKNARGRVVGYRATLGPVEGQGDTSVMAAEACEGNASRALARLDRGGRVGRWRGHLYVVFPTVSGWSYWLDTHSSVDAVNDCGAARETREDAEDAALHHLAQGVWDLDVVDDAPFVEGLPHEVAAEVLSWTRWQRGYARARAAGLSDHEAHRRAEEYAARPGAVARDYQTGEVLEGPVTVRLAQESATAEPTGAVLAYPDETGAWVYLVEPVPSSAGREYRTVYVEERRS